MKPMPEIKVGSIVAFKQKNPVWCDVVAIEEDGRDTLLFVKPHGTDDPAQIKYKRIVRKVKP